MSSGSGTTVSQTETGPPEWLEAYYQQAFGGLDPGDAQLDYTPNADQVAAWDAARAYATGGAQDFADTTTAAYNEALGATDVYNNPVLRNVAESIQGAHETNFLENIAPGNRQSAQQAGQGASGTRADLVAGTSAGRAAEGSARAIADFYGGAYQSGLSAQGNALNQASNISGINQTPFDLLSQVGTEQFDLNLLQQNAGWESLMQFLAALGTFPGAESTGVSGDAPPGSVTI